MGKSSKDKRDAYYRLAKEQNWRARSAFKLIQIDEEFDLFSYADPSSCTRVVDLCAAPGSWSQVLSRVLIKGESFGRRAWVEKQERQNAILEEGDSHDLASTPSEYTQPDPSSELRPRKDVKIVSIDLQPMTPLDGITTLKADITHPSTIPLLLNALDPESHPLTTSTSTLPQNTNTHLVDLVISDGAPDVTGLHDLDIYIQSQLLYAALNLSACILRPGGKFVAKIFRGRDVDVIYAQLKCVFQRVSIAKPRSSRASSLEAFVVCEGFSPPEGWSASLDNPLGNISSKPQDTAAVEQQTRTTLPNGTIQLTVPARNPPPPSRWVAPFLACGDLSAWDADATYKLPPDYVHLDPVQPPTAPPYKRALEMKRRMGGMYGKTGGKKGADMMDLDV